ncbi:MAG: alanine racemase [Ignavibacteriales bacterium]|nr:alanine racemase [Ignavibacteriales bacterium]
MRPTFAEIDLHAINTNLRNIRKKIGQQPRIMAVVKANAYGHGMIPVVESIVKKKTAQYFGVAIVEEGAFPTIPIHVFTAPLGQQLESYVRYNLEPTVCDLAIAQRLNARAKRVQKKVSIHIKIDTGMGRIGVQPEQAVEFVMKVVALSNLTVKGIWTHFATSDERDLAFAQKQLSTFRSIVTRLELAGIHIPIVHCANSGAIMQMPESYFDMVRPGIMMYGYAPSHETRQTVQLQQALSVKAKVGFVKRVPKGTSISYGRRYFATKKTTIASVSIGYADGYFRTLTNKATALIKGRAYPVVGTVCMDQIMIDVGNADVRVGDEVVLIGKSGKKNITGWQIADAVGTIPYEVTCAISQRVPRKYINGK